MLYRTPDQDLSPRGATLAVTFLFLAGAAIRLAYWFEFRASDVRVLLFKEFMDSFIYHTWAERIASGDVMLGDGLFTLSPVYSYLLAPIYAVAGPDMFTAILVQLLLGAAGIVLIYAAGSIVFNRLTGVLAAGLTSLYGPYVMTEGVILSEAFMPFLSAAFILWTAWSLTKASSPLFIGSGFLLGMLFSIRPQYFMVVLLLPLFGWFLPVLWGILTRKKREFQGRILKILILGALGAATAVAPLAIRNYVATGQPVLLTMSGGVNFYIGNNRKAPGTWHVPEGFGATQAQMFQDFATSAGGGAYGPRHSRYWFSRTISEIFDDPFHWIRLMVKKAGLFWNNYEIPLNFNPGLYREHLAVPHFAFIGFCVVGPLGLLGMALAFYNHKGRWLLLITVGYFLGTILFFVGGRYRLAAVPYLMLFASYAAVKTAELLKERNWSTLCYCTLLLVFGITVTLRPPPRVPGSLTAKEYHFMGSYFDRQGDYIRAERWIRKGLAFEPYNPDALAGLGAILLKMGRLEEAEIYVRKALEIQPNNRDFMRLLELIRKRSGSTIL